MKKIIITLLTLALALLSFVTATYAWITMARVNLIDELTLVATLGDDIEISIDGENFYKELPEDILLQNLRKTSLLEMTSSDGKTFAHKNSDVQVIKNVNYLSFDFTIRTDSKREHEVYLANNVSNNAAFDEPPKEGTFVVSKGVSFKSPIRYLYDENDYVEAGETRTYFASGAVRIATITQNADGEVVKIFDLSGDEHRGFGKPYGAVAYYNAKHPENRLEIPTTIHPTIYKLSEFDPNGPFAYDDTSHLVSLNEIVEANGKTYYQGKVTINIWLEGWDADLFDAVIKDRIKIQLQFKAVRK